MGDVYIQLESALHNPNIPRTYSSQVAGLPFRHAYDPDPTKPWFTIGRTFEWVALDLTGYQKINRWMIHKHDFSAAFSGHLQESALADFSVLTQNVAFNQLKYAAGGGTSILIPANARTFAVEFPITATKNFQRLLLEDSTNPSGRLEIGIIHPANSLSIKNFAYGWVDEVIDDSVLFDADQGTPYSRPTKQRRRIKATIFLGDLDTQQAYRKIQALGVGFTTFLSMNPFYQDSSFSSMSVPEWVYGRFTRIGELNESINLGFSARVPEKDRTLATFDFDFEEIEGPELPTF